MINIVPNISFFIDFFIKNLLKYHNNITYENIQEIINKFQKFELTKKYINNKIKLVNV